MTFFRPTSCHLSLLLLSCGFKVFLHTKAVLTPRRNQLHGILSFNYPSCKRDGENRQRAVFCEARQMLHGASLPRIEGGPREAASWGQGWATHTPWFRALRASVPRPFLYRFQILMKNYQWWRLCRLMPTNEQCKAGNSMNGELGTVKRKFWGPIVNTEHCWCQDGLFWNASETWNTLGIWENQGLC